MRDVTYHSHPNLAHLPEAEWVPRISWIAEVVAGIPIEDVISNGTAGKAQAVEVYANHGRWIAECPDCHGAQLASRTDHRFMCNNCANSSVDGLWRPVVWPKDAAKIEAALEERPHAHNRHWSPGETVRDLKAENKAGAS